MTTVRALVAASLVILAGCDRGFQASDAPTPVASSAASNVTSGSSPVGSASASATSAAAAGAPSSFGAVLDPAIKVVALADLARDPKAFDGKRVRTRGEIVAVCQAAGCWTDLRPEGASDAGTIAPTHVTMHGHGFFLPKDSRGRVAEVEGIVSEKTLTKEECDHYNSEGASLVAGTTALRIDAFGIALR